MRGEVKPRKHVAVTAAALLLLQVGHGLQATGAPARAPSQASPPPNVVIVVTDDQRDGLGVMRQTRELLADKGYRFNNAITTTPLCCPARASIFTGRYAHNTGVRTEADAAELNQQSTLQYYLQQAGYRTALFGKYLNSWNINNPPPYFDEWAFFKRSRPSYRGGTWNVDGTVTTLHNYSTTYLGRRALHFIAHQDRAAPEQPWFMYVATTAPHSPYTAIDPYRKRSVGRFHWTPAMLERDRSDKPPYVQVQRARGGAGPSLRKRQLRTLMSVDDLVATIGAGLRRSGEIRDTMIFFISDNGFLWGEHGLTRKAVPYTPSIEVPFLMRVAGTIRSVTDERLVGNIDIAPTVMEAAGLEPTNAPMDGRSLLGDDARDRLLVEYFQEPDSRGGSRFEAPTWGSLRTADYQYIEYYDDNGAVTFREYYDLNADPYQLDNVLGDDDPANDVDAVTLEFLSQQLARDRSCSGTEGVQACP